jgi:hypothetical protein
LIDRRRHSSILYVPLGRDWQSVNKAESSYGEVQSQALVVSTSVSKFCKAGNLFEIST